MNNTQVVLKELFGFDTFRPYQQEIVEAILDRQDALVVMATGGGKSLCYQLPAHMMKGTCMVISPLISLMKDQVDAARAMGLRAAYLNSSMSSAEQDVVSRRLAENKIDLIYVSPERFAMEHFLSVLSRVNLSFAAIDEAHCISEWGHDFRPDYLNLSQIMIRFPDVPVTAFTATATWKVQQDIIERLGLRSPHMVRATFNRANLFYRVVLKDNPSQQILSFVRQHQGEAGIIYRTTRKSVEATARELAANGVKARPYHAGLTAEERAANQEAFNRDEIDVIVATIAFGMGIDKSNVRYVLHADLPKNIEGYYQETGRAGRDGEPAVCLLLFGRGDIPKMRYFIDQIENKEEHKHALKCLNEMADYASLNLCRRKQLLAYFGEEYKQENCGACDICADEVEKENATRDAQIMMSAIKRTGERFGKGHVVDVVTGADTQRIHQIGHDQIKTYGAGKDRDKRYWRFLIDNLLAQEMIRQTDDRYPILKLQPAGEAVLFKGVDFFVLRQKDSVSTQKKRALECEFDESLFAELRVLRKQIADDEHVPPFVVFSDRSLREMACEMPVTDEEMLAVSGVGLVKNDRYGAAFKKCIEQFRTAHPEVRPGRVHSVDSTPKKAKKKAVVKGSTYDETWRLFEKGLSIKQMAQQRQLGVSTIIAHLEKLAANGKSIHVDIDSDVSPENRRLIEKSFAKHGIERLAPIVAEAEGKVTYEDARLVRLWMSSKKNAGFLN